MSEEIVWKVPENLYRELVWAQQELEYPNLSDLFLAFLALMLPLKRC